MRHTVSRHYAFTTISCRVEKQNVRVWKGILQIEIVKVLDDLALKYALTHCEKVKTMKDDCMIPNCRQAPTTSLKKGKKKWAPPHQVCFLIPVNMARDETSPRTGPGQIYGPPDVADLQPLFNLQIPGTWRSYSWSLNL